MRNDIENSKQQVIQWVEACEPKAWICRQLKCRPDTLNAYLKKWNVEYRGSQGTRGRDTDYKVPNKLSVEELKTRSWLSSHWFKLRLYKEGLKKPVCELCGIEEWLQRPISMHLHHIDGNRFNNELDNLQILCPNCHSQTDSYAKPLHKRD